MFESVIEDLYSQLKVSENAAKSAHSQATHSECVAQSRYDTLGLELAYLAQGQSVRAAQLSMEISRIKKLSLQQSSIQSGTEQISLTSLVTLNNTSSAANGIKHYFILPINGGANLQLFTQSVLIISNNSPLGSALIGKYRDDCVLINQTEYQVMDIR
ncbi:MAG: GreA/GreB family elongation factor [Oceanospirillaceae bacterium]|nr:GreA/GreB family elongation factor [Oceanospirillaceae bacterium]